MKATLALNRFNPNTRTHLFFSHMVDYLLFTTCYNYSELDPWTLIVHNHLNMFFHAINGLIDDFLMETLLVTFCNCLRTERNFEGLQLY